MTRDEKLSQISAVLFHGRVPTEQDKTRLEEKTDEQLDYILSSSNQCTYVEAYAGSGKTEILALKAAYEICKWDDRKSGIAVLTFTNEASATVIDRVSYFYSKPLPSNHFIGTFSSFVHGYIAQRFGYKVYGYQRDEPDKSFVVVDSDTSAYNNQWLKHYKLNFQIQSQPIYANQLDYRRKWFVSQKEAPHSLDDLICSQNKPKADNESQIKYLHSKVIECKQKFWNAGFATFEDMNLFAIKCLENAEICRIISKKFPVILVDECQDLSGNELCVLQHLINAGTAVHYIGDLHQAIYSFKDASPDLFRKHIQRAAFNTMCLSQNFRSTQCIVDFSRKIGGITAPISGNIESKCRQFDCSYLEYSEINNALLDFIAILNHFEIPVEKSAVLVRTRSLKSRILDGDRCDYFKHPLINSIQLWQQDELHAKRMALNLIAFQLQKWIGFQGIQNRNYYCEEVCPSPVSWRLLLRDILDSLCAKFPIVDMHNQTYSLWYTSNKAQIIDVINQHLKGIGQNISGIPIRSPSGTGKQLIETVHLNVRPRIKVETVHAAKGCTFDAVLLLSTASSQGKTGYWKSWLDPNDEAGRIAYVGSTRSRYLLVWGVSTLSDTERSELETLGLSKISTSSFLAEQ